MRLADRRRRPDELAGAGHRSAPTRSSAPEHVGAAWPSSDRPSEPAGRTADGRSLESRPVEAAGACRAFAALLADADARRPTPRSGATIDRRRHRLRPILSRYTAEQPNRRPQRRADLDRARTGRTPSPSVTADRRSAGREARARLELLMQLRQVGVPVSVNPRRRHAQPVPGAGGDPRASCRRRPRRPRGAGQVLAIVGESGPALRAAPDAGPACCGSPAHEHRGGRADRGRRPAGHAPDQRPAPRRAPAASGDCACRPARRSWSSPPTPTADRPG